MRHDGLTELEYVVMAMIESGQSSGYAMRKEMNRRRGRWSTDSGSVYRVLHRLDERGYVDAVRRAGVPKRERVEYELTKSGRDLLLKWLRSDMETSEFLHVTDPLRMRATYLEHLPAEERRIILEDWRIRTKEAIADINRESGRLPQKERIALANLHELLIGRLRWLEDISRNSGAPSHAVVESSGSLLGSARD